MKGFAMLKIGQTGWIEKEAPVCGPMDAICKPLALAPCTSDVHTVWAGAIGDRKDMILGHEAVGEIVEVGKLVKDFKVGDRVLVSAITPDWNSLEAQGGFAMHSGGMLSGWKFSNFKDGVFGEYFHVNDADGNLALLPEGMDLGAACMISDMVPTGFHGAELAEIQFGDTVASPLRPFAARPISTPWDRVKTAPSSPWNSARRISSTTVRATLWSRSWRKPTARA